MTSNSLTRRSFLASTIATATSLALSRFASAADKPNSVFNGVRIGCITYSYRSMAKTAEETLKALLDDGLSETELMGGPTQLFAGIKGGKITDAEREQQIAKCIEMRKMYDDAGVNIHIHKMGFGQSNEEIEFNFLVAKALGCTAVTTERNAVLAARVAPFADERQIWVGFHNHTNNLPEMDAFDSILDLGQYIGFNLDIGHYVAGTKGKSPIPCLRSITLASANLHLKDRTAEGGNVPWGQGQNTDQRSAAVDGEVELPRRDRAGIQDPRRLHRRRRGEKVVQYCKEALA